MSQGYPPTGQSAGALINFVPVDVVVGFRGIHETSTTQYHPLGTTCQAQDMGPANLGLAKFIYLKGVANTAAGSVVTYDAVQGITQLLVDDGTPEAGPLAVAMSANVAGPNYGWYCVQGNVPVLTSDGAINTPGMINATAGSLKTSGEATTDLVAGCYFTSTFGPAATTVASGSNGAVLPVTTLHLTSGSGIANAPGYVKVTNTAGVQQIIKYTAVSTNDLTGCSGGVGTLATGGVVEAFPGTGFALMNIAWPAYSGGVVPA